MARIIGTAQDDILNGTDAKDLLLGLAGNDTLSGFLKAAITRSTVK